MRQLRREPTRQINTELIYRKTTATQLFVLIQCKSYNKCVSENALTKDLQVKLERLDAFSKTTNDFTKQESARKMLTKVNVTYDRDTMFVITLEIAKTND